MYYCVCQCFQSSIIVVWNSPRTFQTGWTVLSKLFSTFPRTLQNLYANRFTVVEVHCHHWFIYVELHVSDWIKLSQLHIVIIVIWIMTRKSYLQFCHFARGHFVLVWRIKHERWRFRNSSYHSRQPLKWNLCSYPPNIIWCTAHV